MVLKDQEALDNLVVLERGTELIWNKRGLTLTTQIPKGAGKREIAAHLRAVAGGIDRQVQLENL